MYRVLENHREQCSYIAQYEVETEVVRVREGGRDGGKKGRRNEEEEWKGQRGGKRKESQLV